MPSSHPALPLGVLEAIPQPHPQGTAAAQRWARLTLDLVLQPTLWHKLGFAVQWAKWIEWEGGLDLKSPTSRSSPGVLYLQNPLHPFPLNNLLNSVDLPLIDVETLVGCVDTGDWTCLLKEEQTDPKLRDQAAQSLENLCLLSFYLRWSLPGLSVAPLPVDGPEQGMLRDLVGRILSEGPTPPSGRSSIWHQAFSEQALRLTPQQDPRNPTLPSKLSVLLNELLEVVRLDKIRRDGWTDPNVSNSLSDAQFQQLGKLLSTSFFTIIEFADVSLYMPVENIVFLSKFGAQLPASWYSDDFLRTTIRMARKYLLTEKQDKVRVPIQVQGLAAMSTLWSFWMRKTGSGDANVLGQDLVEIMADILATPSLFIGTESRGLFSACFSGLATGLDKWAGLMEPQVVEGLMAGLERGRVTAQDQDMEGIQASLATVLRSKLLLENSPESIKRLTTGILKSFYGDVEALMTPGLVGIEELLQVQRLFQFIVTQNAGLAAVAEENESEKKKKRKQKKAVVLKGQKWWQALFHGIQDASSEKDAVPSLLAIAGILRAVQHAEDDPPKVDGESLAMIEDIYVGKLQAVLDSLQSPEKRIHLPPQTQACLIFATSQTIPSLPTCKSRLGSDYCALLANLLVDNMLDLNKDGILPLGQILRVIGQDLFIHGSKGNYLPVEGEAHSLLTKTVRGPLFSEMGRIARTVATLLEGVEDWKEIGSILQRMRSFAINIHADWSRNRLSQADTFLVPEPGQEKEAGVMQLDQESTKAMAMLFQVFKTLLFAYTMIFGAVVEKSSTEPVPARLVSHLDYLILDSYAYLYFTTYKLGPGGFQVYEELITTVLTRMVAAETPVDPQLNSSLQGNHHVLLNKTLEAMMPKAELGYGDVVMESRTLYFMNLLERLMPAIEESFLEDKLLALVYPYLLKNDQKDLFESAHSVVMSVFLTNKRIAKNVAPFYSNLLLAHFPREINIDQLRAAFTTMIRSLSETEDALAWLCVEKLLKRIQQYDREIAELAQVVEAPVVSEEKALVSVATDLSRDLTPQATPSQLPSLVTTIATSVTKPSVSPMRLLELQKERGQLLLALFDQLSSLNLVFVETLGHKIRELLVQETSATARQALLKCLLDVIGGPQVDHTKRDWVVKWYLELVNDFGVKSKAKAVKGEEAR
ncbi:hypothetical protein BGZ74_006371 [Mortierella antarctica]|nr:hypothetical protein BGZ74_006371 [Mortierella antarctica]